MKTHLLSQWKRVGLCIGCVTWGLVVGFGLQNPGYAQGTVEITSVSNTTNGVRLTWTASGAREAYTVQVRDSLTSGTWRKATTRYRWPWTFTHWADLPVALPSTRYYRVLVEPIPEAKRGRLISNQLRSRYTVDDLKPFFNDFGISDRVQPKYGILNRPFTYETIDPFGMPITASGVLVLPQGASGALPLLSMQHMTILQKQFAPSQWEGREDYFWGVVFASYGYAVVMPDFIGLGSSPGFQAYVHAQSEATAVVDGLRAARVLCTNLQVTLNSQLFLTGYSQGGHATMAAHRELEAMHSTEFAVTASAPCAGAYDLGGVTINNIIQRRDYEASQDIAVVLASYLGIYDLADTLEELLAEPYRRTLPPVLDSAHNPLEISSRMPADVFSILRPDYLQDFRTNIQNPLRQAFLDNNTYDWTPKAPLKMFHCSGDIDVIFANAEVALQRFTEGGACCVSLVDPGAPKALHHDSCSMPSLLGVLEWFESLRQ